MSLSTFEQRFGAVHIDRMKALRMNKDSSAPKLSIEEVEVPSPGAGEVLVKIRASFIQPADIGNSIGAFETTTYPRTIGKDFAGIVVQGNEQWKGKRVFGTSGNSFSFTRDGAQAEYAIVPADGLAEMPMNLSFAQAASLGTPWTTAHMIITRAQTQPGDVVMVLGATGSVGSAVVQIAKLKGCRTIGVGRHGTDIDSTEVPGLSKAKGMTDGRGPDVVVDTVGDFSLTKAGFQVLNNYGRLVTITAPKHGSTDLQIDILSLYRRQISLIGCNSAAETQEAMAEVLRELGPAFVSGKLTAPEEHSMNKISLDQAVEAYSGRIKKAVIVFDE